MTRLHVLVLALLASAGQGWAGAVPPARPNVLWLIIEDVCPDFGCYGNESVRTPNIDRFAREARLYRNAFATAPVRENIAVFTNWA